MTSELALKNYKNHKKTKIVHNIVYNVYHIVTTYRLGSAAGSWSSLVKSGPCQHTPSTPSASALIASRKADPAPGQSV
ncbi:hypothetical protein T4A_1875 [Trichinella pseudospiralis]|uniref:Uncharacterized protein n=1 Tax=Trichinella pseudospiralis TaxID=6337 RepID=A0A0V1EEG4_TRIPS|nr:hypothetical protein T4A_1875 [Trichinella pseudospiralis]